MDTGLSKHFYRISTLILEFVIFMCVVFKGKKTGKNLEIYEDNEGIIQIRNLKRHEINDIRDVYGLIKSGVSHPSSFYQYLPNFFR